jgi:uncharacterized protein YciI
MRRILFTVALMALASIAAHAQKYDGDLAKKLGADEHGMKKYVFCMLKTGPNDAKFAGKARDDLFAGHFANIKRLAAQGKLALAGPFDKNEFNARGLFIFNVETVDEARALVAADPTVKAGVLVAELMPWYGSAALMEVNRIHNNIKKKDF